jgi:hypothetical protein
MLKEFLAKTQSRKGCLRQFGISRRFRRLRRLSVGMGVGSETIFLADFADFAESVSVRWNVRVCLLHASFSQTCPPEL